MVPISIARRVPGREAPALHQRVECSINAVHCHYFKDAQLAFRQQISQSLLLHRR